MGKVTEDEYHNLAAKHGFEWIGEYPKDTGKLTLWRCQNGHEFMSRYSHIQRGDGCPECYGNKRKSPEAYKAMAQWHGLTWLGTEETSVIKTTTWAMPNGTVFKDTFRNLAEKQARGIRMADRPEIVKRRIVGEISKERRGKRR